ncbi:MAG: polysaccharide biosynthesis/export family protein [Elusimicrobiota bacterium]
MNGRIAWMMAILALLNPRAAFSAEGQEYRIGVGDVLSIRVLNEQSLHNTYTVSPDKTISFPLIGQLSVGDMTLSEIQASLTKQLENGFLRRPVVTVALEKNNSRRFFIYGEVKAPGEFKLSSDVMTVMQAISLAGGLTKSASESKIKILRPKDKEQAYTVIEVDVKQIISTGLSDAAIKNNDIVVVRQGWL